MEQEQTFTAAQAAAHLGVDVSLIARLCRAKRLGYTRGRHGKSWVITLGEIRAYLDAPRRKPGRPRRAT